MRLLAACSLLVAAVAAGCGGAAPTAPQAAPAALLVSSNVERRDYAGSESCATCHAAIYEKWRSSPMRRMTRIDAPGAIHAPFDGATWTFKGDKVTTETREGRRYMRVESQANGVQLFQVTKVIGGRYREDFVGREIVDGAPSGGEEPILPVSWLIFARQWRYKGYSVMVKERPHFGKHGAPWRQTCIFCHNTEPYLATIYDDLLGGGRPYQGSVSDRLMAGDRLWKAEIADPERLGHAVKEELATLGAPPPKPGADTKELLDGAVRATLDRFGERQLVEVGIGCEACHNGSREHAEDPTKRPSFEPRSAFLHMDTPNPSRRGPPGKAEWINHTCARCHTVLFSRYPYTWEGGLRSKHPGGSAINSGEARDFLLGGCSSAMACSACHDPHTEDRREDLDRLGTIAGNPVCTKCHAAYADRAALARHTHHAPEGEGSACLACHMPKKNAGLSYRLSRYHRIGSPTDRDRVENDRPLECALCHADKSVSALVASMEAWWKKSYDRQKLAALYGEDLGRSPILVAALSGKPHEQMTAAGVLADRGERGDAAALAPMLWSEYPLVRYWGREAIERLTGEPLDIDLDGEVSAIQRAAIILDRAGARQEHAR